MAISNTLCGARSIINVTEFVTREGLLYIVTPYFRNGGYWVINRELAQPTAILVEKKVSNKFDELQAVINAVAYSQCWMIDDYRNVNSLAMGKICGRWFSQLPIMNTSLPIEYIIDDKKLPALEDEYADLKGIITDIAPDTENLGLSPKITLNISQIKGRDQQIAPTTKSDTVTHSDYRKLVELFRKQSKSIALELADTKLINNKDRAMNGEVIFIASGFKVQECEFIADDFDEYSDYFLVDGQLVDIHKGMDNSEFLEVYPLGYRFISKQDIEDFQKAFYVSIQESDLSLFLINSLQVTGISFK